MSSLCVKVEPARPRTVRAVAGLSLGVSMLPDLTPERHAVQCETPIPAREMDPRGPPCKTWPAPRSCRHGSPPTTARRSGAGRSQGRLFACRARQRPRPSTTRIALAACSKNRTRTKGPVLRPGGACGGTRTKGRTLRAPCRSKSPARRKRRAARAQLRACGVRTLARLHCGL